MSIIKSNYHTDVKLVQTLISWLSSLIRNISENQASSTFPHALISFHHINPISSRNLSSLPAGTCVLSSTAKLEKQLEKNSKTDL